MVLLMICGCRDSKDAQRTTATSAVAEESNTLTSEGAGSARELAIELGCDSPEPIHPMNGPIRGGAATEGVSCFEDHLALDVFVRSPIGDGHGSAAGGSLENIDRLLTETGAPGTPGCSVLVTDDWVITSNHREELERVRDELGGAVRPIKQLSSPVSYHLRGCL